MIIDGHAHACGCYHNAKSTIDYLISNKIDKVILCPGEVNSSRNYKLPMLSNLFHSSNLGYNFNKIIRFITSIKGLSKHIDEQNVVVGNMAKLHPDMIIQAYWVNILDRNCMIKLNRNFEIFKFPMLKLHQCWNNFEILSQDFVKIIQWAINKDIPIFIHLISKKQAIEFAKLTNDFLSAKFIVAHMIGLEEVVANSRSSNIYFDISAPQLISFQRIEKSLKTVGSDRIILGSDSPYGTNNIKTNLDLLNRLSISEYERQNIAGNNVARLIHIL